MEDKRDDPKKSPVFEETYHHYLKKISKLNLASRAGVLGGHIDKNALKLSCFGQTYGVGPQGVHDPKGRRVPFSVAVVLLKYVLMCPQKDPGPPTDWLTYRDFKDAGPLITFYSANVVKPIEQAYQGRAGDLAEKCMNLGGVPGRFAGSYDVSVMVPVLPRIPVQVNFNDADEEFGPYLTLLYPDTTEQFLDMESVAMSGSWLKNLLMGHR